MNLETVPQRQVPGSPIRPAPWPASPPTIRVSLKLPIRPAASCTACSFCWAKWSRVFDGLCGNSSKPKSLREDNLGLSGRSIFRTLFKTRTAHKLTPLTFSLLLPPGFFVAFRALVLASSSEENPIPNTASSLPQPFSRPNGRGPSANRKARPIPSCPALFLGPRAALFVNRKADYSSQGSLQGRGLLFPASPRAPGTAKGRAATWRHPELETQSKAKRKGSSGSAHRPDAGEVDSCTTTIHASGAARPVAEDAATTADPEHRDWPGHWGPGISNLYPSGLQTREDRMGGRAAKASRRAVRGGRKNRSYENLITSNAEPKI